MAADLYLIDPLPAEEAAGAARADIVAPAFEDRLITAGVWLAVTAGILLALVHFVNAATVATPHLDANGEHNILAWASSCAALAVAIGAGLAWLAGASRPRLLLGVVACTIYLSVDEAIVLHENITWGVLGLFGIPDVYDSIVWPLLYMPLLLTTALLLVRVSDRAPARGRLTVLHGLACLGFALVLEAASTPWSNDRNLVHTIEGGFEESAELAGWILIATGVATIALEVLRRLYRKTRLSPV